VSTDPTLPDIPAAKTCEHFYASHCYRGMSIRLCMLCHEPDWDDLERQLSGAVGAITLDDGECERLAALVRERAAEADALSAVCTGPDCGERFTDSETGEYEFATRERMEKLLRADGWTTSPVLCPACQEGAL